MDCIYTSFVNKLYSYLTKSNEPLLGGIIKKHDHLLFKGDLSFPSNISSWKSYLSDDFSCNNTKILSTKDDCEKLIHQSKIWSLRIDKCSVQNELVVIHLDRIYCFQNVLSDALSKNDTYGSYSNENPVNYFIQFEVDSEHVLNLTELRIKLLKEATCRLIEFYGHRVSEKENSVKIQVTCKSNCVEDGQINILCGPVVDMLDGKKCLTVTSDEFYKKREMDMRLLAEHKYGLRISSVPAWRELFVSLGNAAVIIEMLQIKPSNSLKINFNDPNYSNNKGASFIMYNCARIASIISKFENEIITGELELPDLNNIDFSLLNQDEEWELFYNFILYFPVLIKNCVQIDKGIINPHYICSFLFGLCSKFSVYYRRVRILTSFRAHMLPTMYARIYLLKLIQIVFHNALRILNIKPITQM